jgi:hypothetical protein
LKHVVKYSFHSATAPSGPGDPGFTITLRHATLGRTSLDGRSACRRDLYLTTHNTHNTDRHPQDSPGLEISPSQRPLPDNTQHSQQTDIHRTPLDRRSARRRDLYLTTHNTHNRQTVTGSTTDKVCFDSPLSQKIFLSSKTLRQLWRPPPSPLSSG